MSAKKIIIVGGGATGWTVANLLRKQLPERLAIIQLVDDSRRDTALAEASRAAIHGFHDMIGLPEKTCIQGADASFNLGILYKNWSFLSQEFALAEGIYGAPLDDVDFHQLFAKSVHLNFRHSFDDYSINAAAAKLGHFGHPVSDPKSIYSSIKYGLNVHLDGYADILKRHALNLGVEVFNGDCAAVCISETDGAITSIKLSSGDTLAADIFIDCSGESSVLLGSALAVDSVKDDQSQVFDTLAFGFRDADGDIKSAAVLQQGHFGYLKKIPLRNQEAVSYYFSSQFASKDTIKKEMLECGVTDVQFFDAALKQKKYCWVKNCLAVGGSALSIYDIYLSPLHIVRNSIVRFVDLLMNFDNLDASRREYNRLSVIEFERIKELIELQLYVTKDSSEVLKKHYAKNTLSDDARHRLQLFSSTGRHPYFDGGVISDMEWAAFFWGNGILPKTCSLNADSVDKDKLFDFMVKLRAIIYKSAENMPSQTEYIAKIMAEK
jgi:tryptophan halogenase